METAGRLLLTGALVCALGMTVAVTMTAAGLVAIREALRGGCPCGVCE